eukprot:TRINITY_DN7216_c0_g1_i1.p1 TRINITY_DN7216_c0_g1~~TRINITY_DN7216_c0_g1_i1.p1  ORF type:complete len:373 (-),score=54.59 TRINITY_DN7216_c0_g1_i1:55-1173(-)
MQTYLWRTLVKTSHRKFESVIQSPLVAVIYCRHVSKRRVGRFFSSSGQTDRKKLGEDDKNDVGNDRYEISKVEESKNVSGIAPPQGEESEHLFMDLVKEDKQIVFEEKESKLMDDYTNSPTVMKFDEDNEKSSFLSNEFVSKDGYKTNLAIEMQLKDNPLALQVLKEGAIDLKDERIKVESLNMIENNVIGLGSQELKQINLGKVQAIQKDSILLEDVDVYNIPDDKKIVLDHEESEIVLVGRKVAKESRGDEDGEQNARTGTSGDLFIQTVNKDIFVERSFEDFKREHLFEFESDFVQFNRRDLLRDLIRLGPIFLIVYCFFDTAVDVYQVKRSVHLIEEQELKALNQLRNDFVNEELLNNPLYDRKNFQL